MRVIHSLRLSLEYGSGLVVECASAGFAFVAFESLFVISMAFHCS